MHTIAMDTYPFMAKSVLVVEGVVTQRDPALSPSAGEGNPSPEPVSSPAVVRRTTVKIAQSCPLANVHSPRDNQPYRASFTTPNRPQIPPPEDRP